MDNLFHYLSNLGQLSYFGSYLLIVGAGHIVPIPEDIALIAVGYFTSFGQLSLVGMLLAVILGAITGDFILFYLAKKGARFAINLERHIKNEIFEFIKRKMQEKSFWTIFMMRFIPGFRFTSPLVAGYVGLSWKKYWLANIISGCVYAPSYFFLGYLFHARILALIGVAGSLRHLVFVGIVIILFGTLALVVRRKILKSE